MSENDDLRCTAVSDSGERCVLAANHYGDNPTQYLHALDGTSDTGDGVRRFGVGGHMPSTPRLTPTGEEIDGLLQLWKVHPSRPTEGNELANYRRRVRNAILALLKGEES
ncbi:MAG TPA: hypothetical protein VGH54_09875 [Mycobacterium sp.]|uniref:hypothetical protein n=1 Tax=Mycobacterium sp. TaxID=1785 RepID=UPI002F3E8C0E